MEPQLCVSIARKFSKSQVPAKAIEIVCHLFISVGGCNEMPQYVRFLKKPPSYIFENTCDYG
jgi:hypothetical protein